MSGSTSTYAVGYGQPPLHSRFQKGQSGNPSGKPEPAKLAKQCFERALFAALEGSEAELEQSKPDKLVATVAKRIALDAAAGRIASVKLLLSLLDAGCKQADAEEAAAREAEETEALSLVQGITQGSDAKCLEDILWPDLRDWVLEESRSREPAREVPAAAPVRNEAKPVSLVQGKTQGNNKLSAEKIRTVPEWEKAPVVTDRRALLMTSAGVSLPPGRQKSALDKEAWRLRA
jgi:hypothetical protein